MNTATASGNFIYKTLYAALFLVMVPGMLWLWATMTDDLITLPVIESAPAGWLLAGAGFLLMAWGMIALMKYGKGLPMNAFPPEKLVTRGAYRVCRHPIYWGFGMLIAGFFILSGSASGLWLVTPVTILAMTALVMGYEAIDLKERFPGMSVKTLLDLPANLREAPGSADRPAALLRVLAPMFLVNFIVAFLADGVDAAWGRPLLLSVPVEYRFLPLLSLVFIMSVPILLKRKDLLRTWAISGMIAMLIAAFTALLAPGVFAQYLSVQHGSVTFVPVFLLLLSVDAFFRQSKTLGAVMGTIAVPLMGIQLAFSRSAVLHLGIAVFIYLLAGHYLNIWDLLRRGAERIANSWHEWVFGKIRVINHGFYVGFGTFAGILLAGTLAGDAYAWGILIFAFVVIVFSALWAQIIEGSEKLKRPFGYYGALVGVIFASLVVWAIGYEVWVIIGVISVAMPWVQAVGRLRCLVNGCCHGSRVDHPGIGIRYYHPRSRVCGISHLKGEPLHPTQLYSILWLILVGCVLLSLWFHELSSPFIFGLYLILTGIGRFVEEAYRGEVQTPVVRGLRLYQWMAILSVLAGIIMTAIHVNAITVTAVVGWQTLVSALIGGLFTAFAMGVDFPGSNARFSRLV
jgi:protein-S-isoprenylcysteine O-methyltransferase Ste14